MAYDRRERLPVQNYRRNIHPESSRSFPPQQPRETPRFPIIHLPPDFIFGEMVFEVVDEHEIRDSLPVCYFCDDPVHPGLTEFIGADHAKSLMPCYVDQDTAEIVLLEHLERVHGINSLHPEDKFYEPYGGICIRDVGNPKR